LINYVSLFVQEAKANSAGLEPKRRSSTQQEAMEHTLVTEDEVSSELKSSPIDPNQVRKKRVPINRQLQSAIERQQQQKLESGRATYISTFCFTAYQCCGFGSGIRCLFTPWIRIRDVFFPDPGSF
jgi:hypothetical protein